MPHAAKRHRIDSGSDLDREVAARSQRQTGHRFPEHSNDIHRRYPILFDREIRLLSIDGSEDFEAPLQCGMTVASLDDKDTSYQTLSYAWESHERTETIQIDGQTVHITKSLFCALRRIRQKESSAKPALKPIKYLWADAVCIDQENDDEKSHQIALMGEIYASSRRLIIWLGEASETDVAELKVALRSSDTLQKRRTVLGNLLGRTWFSRRWTVQELFKSPRAMRHFLVGSYRFLFEKLAAPVFSVSTNGHAGLYFETAVLIVAPLIGTWLRKTSTYPFLDGERTRLGLMTLRCSATYHHDFLLLYLLVRLSPMQCSDPRDIIYSLVGLTVDNDDLRASYDASFEDLLLFVALRHLRNDIPTSSIGAQGWAALKSILLCATVWSPKERPSIPSWVPDWSQPAQFTSDEHRRAVWAASGDFAKPSDDSWTRDIARKNAPGVIVVERGCAATAVPLEIEGFLLRECGHDYETGEDQCPVCGQLTQIWGLRLADDKTIFELEGRQPGGSDCFKLKGYGGYSHHGWVLKRREASSFGSTTDGYLLEGPSVYWPTPIVVNKDIPINLSLR